MDDASMSPSAQLQNIISPAIPAPTQNQGIQRKLMSSGTTKVTDSGKTTKQNPNGHPGTALPWEGHLMKGHQLGSLHNGPERCTWASHSNSNSCLKSIVSLVACQAAGSYANLDIRMHKRRFKWQREVRVTDQDSFSVHIHSVNQLDWKKTQNYQEEGMDE